MYIKANNTIPILPFHLQFHPLQSGENIINAGPFTWGIVQALLNELNKTGVARTNLFLQNINILPTAFQLTSSLNVINVVRIAVRAGEKVTWKYLQTTGLISSVKCGSCCRAKRDENLAPFQRH